MMKPAMPASSHSDPMTIARIDKSFCRRGDSAEPTSEQTPRTAMIAPILPPENPWWRATTMMMRNVPSNARFVHEHEGARTQERPLPQEPEALCELGAQRRLVALAHLLERRLEREQGC